MYMLVRLSWANKRYLITYDSNLTEKCKKTIFNEYPVASHKGCVSHTNTRTSRIYSGVLPRDEFTQCTRHNSHAVTQQPQNEHIECGKYYVP